MIRFITDILDVKNLLGMQRAIPIPDPMYPMPANASQLGIKILSAGSFIFTPTSASAYIYADLYRGGIVVGNYLMNSGAVRTISSLQAGDVLIFTTSLTDLLIQNNNTESIALNSDLAQLDVSICSGLKCVDFRNATSLLNSVSFSTSGDIQLIYDTANNNATQSAVNWLILNYTPGVLYIDPDGVYYSSLKTLAIARGWTVYDL